MADAAYEFQGYAVRYTKTAAEGRSRLRKESELELYRLVNELSENPESFSGRAEGAPGNNLVYKKPDLSLEITYAVDSRQRVITIVDIQERQIVPTLVVVSYSHLDEKWRKELRKRLELIVREGTIRIWDDRAIDAGETWEESIEEAFGSAGIAILLVSPDFLASDFVSEKELPLLVARAKKSERGLQLLWIAVRPCNFSLVKPIATTQALNDPEHPLSTLPKPAREKELKKVFDKIMEAVDKAPVNVATASQGVLAEREMENGRCPRV